MNYFFIVIAIIFMIYVYFNVKKQDFTIEESVFWILGSIVLLFLSIFYKQLDKLATILGIWYAPSLVFLIAILFLLLMNFRSSKKISKQNEKIIELAQRLSIEEYNIKKIMEEKKTNEKK